MQKIFTWLSSGTGFVVMVALVLAGGIAGAAYYAALSTPNSAPVAQTPTRDSPPAPAPQTVQTAANTPEPDTALPAAPRIDEVRLQSKGVLVIAGRAAPNSQVSVLLDGVSQAEVRAGADGSFAAVSIAEPHENPRVVTITQHGTSDKTTLAGENEIILAPTAALDPKPGEPAQTQSHTAEETTQTVAALDSTQSSNTDDTEAPTAADTDAPTQQVAILRSNPEGIELLAPPEVMSNVALDTISYSQQGDLQLSGRAQLKSDLIRVYINNKAIAELPIDEAGRWRGPLPNVDTGVYTLRIDEVAASGNIFSRIETPLKREDPAQLAAATNRDAAAQAITVQSGATLWAIARQRYGQGTQYVKIFKANQDAIKDPDLIYPGQVFALPDGTE